MLYHTITIEDTGEVYRCSANQSVLAGMEHLGRKGIPVGCRGGGCGVCKIKVLNGSFSARAMSREHVSEQDENDGQVLACRIYPTSDLRLRVLGKLKKSLTASNPLFTTAPPAKEKTRSADAAPFLL
jgi:ferredoxin